MIEEKSSLEPTKTAWDGACCTATARKESDVGLGRRTSRTEADETSNLVAFSVVIMDGDPPPTAAIGRISCNRKNPDIEKLAKKIEREKEKREVKRKATEESDEEEATVTEQEMAKSLSKRRKGTRSEGRQDEDKVNEKE